MSLAGFQNAPFSKAVCVVCACASLLAVSSRTQHLYTLSYEAIFERYQFWRLVACQLPFSRTPGEAIVGVYLLYFFRVFERHVGTSKYSVFALLSMALSTLLQLPLLYLMRSAGADTLASSGSRSRSSSSSTGTLALCSGPYGLLFASFLPFAYDIPPSGRFSIFGVQMSSKSLTYLAGMQLLLSEGRSSVVPAACGLLVGFLYRSNFLGLRKLEWPERVAQACSAFVLPLLSGAPTSGNHTALHGQARVASFRGPRGENSSGRGSGRAGPPSGPQAAVIPPSEEAVEALVQMGFPRDAALRALASGNNDLNVATNILLNASET